MLNSDLKSSNIENVRRMTNGSGGEYAKRTPVEGSSGKSNDKNAMLSKMKTSMQQKYGTQFKVGDHVREKVLPLDDKDVIIYNMVTDVPKVSKPIAVIVAVINFILPGSGTILAACFPTQENEVVSKTQICLGFLMLFTAILGIGFVLAQMWSYFICKKAWTEPSTKGKDTN